MSASQTAQYSELLQERRKQISCSEYSKMISAGILTEQDRVELIDGEIITMIPINSPNAATVKKIKTFLEKLAVGRFIIGVQDPIELPEYSMPEPDIVVAKFKTDYYYLHHPRPDDILLIIEVVDSSYNYDKSVKGSVYARAGIMEYWIIDLSNGRIEVMTEPKGDIYTSTKNFNQEDEITPSLINQVIAVQDLMIFKK